MPFAYYKRLSKKARRIYDASDAVVRVDLACPDAASGARNAIEAGLLLGDKRAVTKAAQAFANAICDDRSVPRLVVRVLAKRPKDDQSELHGLYVREEGQAAIIRVWMRTAERRDVVKPRTFIRTLLHELVHHLDYDLLKLDDSFHTEGFYKRETSLFKQIAGELAAPRPAPKKPRKHKAGEQLSLFDAPA